MEEILQRAIEIATEAHKDQTDRSGKPYIGHITRVSQAGRTLEERMAGILHDIVEDTDWTFERLAGEGIPPQVIDAVRCLTKQEGEDYDRFIERVKTNPIAIEVKLNDLRDNMDVTRIPEIDDWYVAHLRKYHRAYNDLLKLHKEPKKTLYVDMDNVLVDFESGIAQLTSEELDQYRGRLDEVPGIFGKMKPIEGAVEAVKRLSENFDVYILSTAPWRNKSAWYDKPEWIKRHFGDIMKKRLVLSHRKDLNRGDYLIDDRLKNGVAMFNGEHIHFGSERFPDWQAVIDYLL